MGEEAAKLGSNPGRVVMDSLQGARQSRAARRARKSGAALAAMALAVCICAPPASRATDPAVLAHSLDLMDIERATLGRAAVEWTIYDYWLRTSAKGARRLIVTGGLG